MQQATVNLFADMGVQPSALQPGLTPAAASTDTTRPVSAISAPAAGATLVPGSAVTITGTATDSGGQVGGVEVSVDGGATWHPAAGRSAWTYAWTAPTNDAQVAIKTRAVDDSGNLETPGAGITVTVGSGGTSATLQSIAVAPTSAAIPVGGTQPFTATGTYSDATTRDLTAQVTWASIEAAVATVTSAGLATGVGPGTTTISATLSGMTGSTLLTVQAAPLAITTAALPGGTVGSAYSAALAATGGTGSYTWSVISGALPSGLTLSAGGAITGTPTAAATSSFTVQVRDSANTTISKTLSIAVVAAPTTVTIWPSTAVPASASDPDTAAVELGVKFRSDVAGTIKGIRFYKGTTNTGTHVGKLWSSTGTLLASATFTNETASGWQQVNFATPVAITAGTLYVASYHAPNGRYAGDGAYFATTGFRDANSPLYAYRNGESGGNGVYLYGAGGFPTNTYNASNYWVDVAFTPGPAPTLQSIAVTPANPTVQKGGTQQFAATGTYSDNSTQNLTTQVTWASSSPAVATVNTGGLATAVGAGTTSVTASLGAVSGTTSLTVAAPTLQSIALTPANPTLQIGGTQQFTATGSYSDNSTQNLTAQVTWNSSSPTVATVSTGGMATGVSAGTTTVSATLSGVSGSTLLTVAPKLLSIAVTPANPTVQKGGTQQFAATGTYSDNSTQNLTTQVTWASSSPAVATVNAGGLATAVGAGTTSVTATLGAVSGTTSLTVTAPTLQSIALTPANPTLQIGGTQQFTATGSYSDNSTQNLTAQVTWNSSSQTVATVSTGGLATGVNAGTTTVSATLSGVSGGTSLTVAATVPTLTSITLTPANPTIPFGATQPFTATGTYSDATTRDLTAQVTWASIEAAVATVTSAGLATGVGPGTTTISATLSGMTGSTLLTVQAAPLAITTAALPGGTVGSAYSAALAATGGTGSYTWSVISGALPSGLTLSAGGAITGTPTAAATSSFTVQVRDSANTTISKPLSIAVVAAPTTVTIWPSTAVPSLVDGGADNPVELGVKFRSDVAGTITGIRFYKASANTGTHVGNLWSSTGTKLATATFTNETASGWQQVTFATPVPITANTVYVASYHANGGHYSADVNYFASAGVDNPPLHALANGASGGNGVYAYGASSAFPNQTWNSANYWVDVVFQPGPAPTLAVHRRGADECGDSGRWDAAVHGDGDLFGRHHPGPHRPGDLGLYPGGGGHRDERRPGDGSGPRDDDDLRDPERHDREHPVDGASRSARHHHGRVAWRHGRQRLFGGPGGDRRHRVLHVVRDQRRAAQRPDLERWWGDHRDAHGGGDIELHRTGEGFGQHHHQQGAEHRCRCRPHHGHHLAEHGGTEPGGRRCGQSRGAGRQVPIRRRRDHHRDSLLQGQHQYRNPRWQPVVEHRHQAGDGDLRQRDRLGLAAGDLRDPGADYGQHRLCGVVSRQWGALQCRRELLCERRGGQPTAARAGQRRIGRERRLCLRCQQRLPQPDLEQRQLLGGRGVPAVTPTRGRAISRRRL